MEIAPGVHRIKCLFGSNRMVFVHLLVGDEAAMLIDTGCAHNPEQEIVPYMKSIGFDPAHLTFTLISHSDLDHQGGNAPIKQVAPQTLLICHNLDRRWVEDTDALIKGRYSQFESDHGIGYGEEAKASIRADCLSHPLDITIEGGEVFRLSSDWVVETVHTPGHTWGHIAVHDPRSKTLISGEASLWNSILDDDWNPALPPTYCYIDTYISTQERLKTMDIELLSSAHWPIQRGSEVAEFISESKAYCLHVESRLLEFAKEHGPFTLRTAIESLGPNLGTWPVETNQDFSYGMAGNLHRLVKHGLLETDRDAEGHVLWNLPA